MNTDSLMIMWVALAVSWALIPLIVIQYRLVVVPKRYDEIKCHFLRTPMDARDGTSQGGMSAALLYARMRYPDLENEEAAKRVLHGQFWYFHKGSRYAWTLSIVTLLSGLMLFFSGLWIQSRLTRVAGSAPALLDRIDTPIVMALWGAFVWSLYEIWGRRKSGDLTPVEVFDLALRFAVAIPIGYAFSLLVFETVPSLAAFVTSAFPLRDVRQLLRKQVLNKLGESPQGSAALASKGYLGEVLNGIGNDTIVRLEELNIETFLDLAYADPVRLMVRTGSPIQLVLAWIDQALLAVYLAPHKSKLDEIGMPCALDAREFYRDHFVSAPGAQPKDWTIDPAVKGLAAKLGMPVENLEQPLSAIAEDPQVRFLSAAWYGPGAGDEQGE